MYVDLPNVSQHDITSTRKLLLKSAVTKRAQESRKLRQTREALSNKIKEVLMGLDFYILKRTLSHDVDKAANKVIKTQQKKLEKLTRNAKAVLPFTSDETVTNLSSVQLTQEQLGILKLGLKNSNCPTKISKSDVFSCSELIYHTMHKNIKYSKMTGKLATDLSHLVHSPPFKK